MRGAVVTVALCVAAAPVLGAEGASSHYLPGSVGGMLLAVPPEPGLTFANTVWFQSGNVGTTVLDGQVEFGLDLDLVLNIAAASYTFETPVLGGRYSVAAVVPFGHANLDASVTGPNGGRISGSGDSFALSDVVIVPLQLNWNTGAYSWKVSQSIIAPTGAYDVDSAINLGRNYWSFDTNVAMTWFNPEAGLEISIAPGIMFNTENPDTNYKTGAEFHMDFTATQFLRPDFAIGLRGYWYQQVTGDSGSGAILGDYKSESVGIGPGFFWAPAFAEGSLSILGEWMHDVHAKNRFESDYLSLTAAWTF